MAPRSLDVLHVHAVSGSRSRSRGRPGDAVTSARRSSGARRALLAAGVAVALIAALLAASWHSWRDAERRVAASAVMPSPDVLPPPEALVAALALVGGEDPPWPWRDANGWLRRTQLSTGELPEAPRALTDWLEAHGAEIDVLAGELGHASGAELNGLALQHRVGAWRAVRCLGAAALHAVRRGDAERADALLVTAWRLELAVAGTDHAALDPAYLLGVLRFMPRVDARAWTARLDGLDLRGDEIAELQWEARSALRWAARDDRERMPQWLPSPVKTLGSLAHGVPRRIMGARQAKRFLQEREVLVALRPCEEATTALSPAWRLDEARPRLHETPWPTPAGRLSLLAREEAQVALTRAVLVARARGGLPEPPCPSPYDYVATQDAAGWVTLRLAREVPLIGPDRGRGWFGLPDSPRGTWQSFTFLLDTKARPLLASAPAR